MFQKFRYHRLTNILKASQPTYLPPIETRKEGTFVIDGEQKHVESSSNTKEELNHLIENSESNDTARRRWYESDASWKQRKGQHGTKGQHGQKKKDKRGLSRKRWEHSAPVRSLHADRIYQNDSSDDSME